MNKLDLNTFFETRMEEPKKKIKSNAHLQSFRYIIPRQWNPNKNGRLQIESHPLQLFRSRKWFKELIYLKWRTLHKIYDISFIKKCYQRHPFNLFNHQKTSIQFQFESHQRYPFNLCLKGCKLKVINKYIKKI